MSTVTVLSAGVLASVLPISAFALYATLCRHTWLGPGSPMDAAGVDRFDSEAERAAHHAGKAAALQDRRTTLLALYRQEMEAQLAGIDPRRADVFRKALQASNACGLDADPSPASPVAPTAPPPVQQTGQEQVEPAQAEAISAVPAQRPRLASWRERLATRRGNGAHD